MRFWIFLFVCFARLCFADSVLVTLPPYRTIVKTLFGGDVFVLFPAGSDPHVYEPSPKGAWEASSAKVWFRIGMPEEERVLFALKEANSDMHVVSLIDALPKKDLLFEGQSVDPHIWLSVRLMLKQAHIIAAVLKDRFPDRRDAIQRNLEKLSQSLKELDSKMRVMLEPIWGKKIFVSHPAFGYFCRDYGLVQRPLEFHGRQPTIAHVSTILKEARKAHARAVFSQRQSRGLSTIAKQIGARVIVLDPLDEEYFVNLMRIAGAFLDGTDHSS